MKLARLDSALKERLQSGNCIKTINQCIIELVLNSLDANALNIAIRINSNTFCVEVADDGIGIEKENLVNVGKRYYTNKCHSVEDYKRFHHTFGYRGESLALIARSSKRIKIMSRFRNTNDSDIAKCNQKTFQKTITGEKIEISELRSRACFGTTVIIEEFQTNRLEGEEICSSSSESAKVMSFLEEIHFMHPRVVFKLIDCLTDKVVFETDRKNSPEEILFDSSSNIINKENLKFYKTRCSTSTSIKGILMNRPFENNKYQLLFVNKRPVKCFQLKNRINQDLIKSNFGVGKKGKRSPHYVYIFNISCPHSKFNIANDDDVEFKKADSIMKSISNMLKKFLTDEGVIVVKSPKKVLPGHVKKILNLSKFGGTYKATALGSKKQENQYGTRSYNYPNKRGSLDKYAANPYSMPVASVKQQPFNELQLNNNKPEPKYKQCGDLDKKYLLEKYLSDQDVCGGRVSKPEVNLNGPKELGPFDFTLACEEGKFLKCDTKRVKQELNEDIFKNDFLGPHAVSHTQNAIKSKTSLRNHRKQFKNTDDIKVIRYPILNTNDFTINVKPGEKREEFRAPRKVSNDFFDLFTDERCELATQDKIDSHKRAELFEQTLNELSDEEMNNPLENVDYKQTMVNPLEELFSCDKPKETTMQLHSWMMQPTTYEGKDFFPDPASKTKFNYHCSTIQTDKIMSLGGGTIIKHRKIIRRRKRLKQQVTRLIKNKNLYKKQAKERYPKPYISESNSQKKRKSRKKIPLGLIVEQTLAPNKIQCGKVQRYCDNTDKSIQCNFTCSNQKIMHNIEGNGTHSTELFSDFKKDVERLDITNTSSRAEQQILNSKSDRTQDEEIPPYQILNDVVQNAVQPNVDKGSSNGDKDESSQYTNEWTMCIDNEEGPRYINKRTGDNTLSTPEGLQDRKFKRVRSKYLPNGFTQMLKRLPVIKEAVSIETKREFHAALCENAEEDFKYIKWKQHYLQNIDPEVFFKQIYSKEFIKDHTNLKLPEINLVRKALSKFSLKSNSISLNKDCFSQLQVIGQFDMKFIITVCDANGTLVFFDQHAVDERIRLEKLYKVYCVERGGRYVFISNIIDGFKLVLNNMQFSDCKEHVEIFKRFGLEYECLKQNTIKINALPFCLYNKGLRIAAHRKDDVANLTKRLIVEVLNSIQDALHQPHWIPKLLNNIITSEACRSAVKFGDVLTRTECLELIVELAKCKLPFQCAHARPTSIPIYQLDNNFKTKDKIHLKQLIQSNGD